MERLKTAAIARLVMREELKKSGRR
jgi:hypothetical protein